MVDVEVLKGQDHYTATRLAQRADFEEDFLQVLRSLRRVRPVQPGVRMLEIGAGIGWIEVFAELHGFHCEGIEHNPEFIAQARQLGAEFGVEPVIHEADAGSWDYGRDRWDVIIATSVFEHVRDYKPLLRKVYDGLATGGVLLFYSTNKWSFRSGEYPDFPLYGWLPYTVRERIRVRATGSRRIVESAGMDFNQFTYWGIRRDLRHAGFRRMFDRVELVDPAELRSQRPGKRIMVRAVKAIGPLRLAARIFSSGNLVVAQKE
jgi:SAM-dependent methyltransferase